MLLRLPVDVARPVDWLHYRELHVLTWQTQRLEIQGLAKFVKAEIKTFST